jgi:hypothetical protein
MAITSHVSNLITLLDGSRGSVHAAGHTVQCLQLILLPREEVSSRPDNVHGEQKLRNVLSWWSRLDMLCFTT